MIRLKDYTQPMTGVPLSWWEIQSIAIRREKLVKDKNNQHQHLPLDAARSTSIPDEGLTFYYMNVIEVTYGGYAIPPSERVMPVAIHNVSITKEQADQVAELALRGGSGGIYPLIDRFMIDTVEMFKGGSVES